MTDYEIEKQIRQMLEKFKDSDFTKKEPRRVIAEVITNKLKKYFKKDDDGGDSKDRVAQNIQGRIV